MTGLVGHFSADLSGEDVHDEASDSDQLQTLLERAKGIEFQKVCCELAIFLETPNAADTRQRHVQCTECEHGEGVASCAAREVSPCKTPFLHSTQSAKKNRQTQAKQVISLETLLVKSEEEGTLGAWTQRVWADILRICA